MRVLSHIRTTDTQRTRTHIHTHKHTYIQHHSIIPSSFMHPASAIAAVSKPSNPPSDNLHPHLIRASVRVRTRCPRRTLIRPPPRRTPRRRGAQGWSGASLGRFGAAAAPPLTQRQRKQQATVAGQLCGDGSTTHCLNQPPGIVSSIMPSSYTASHSWTLRLPKSHPAIGPSKLTRDSHETST